MPTGLPSPAGHTTLPRLARRSAPWVTVQRAPCVNGLAGLLRETAAPQTSGLETQIRKESNAVRLITPPLEQLWTITRCFAWCHHPRGMASKLWNSEKEACEERSRPRKGAGGSGPRKQQPVPSRAAPPLHPAGGALFPTLGGCVCHQAASHVFLSGSSGAPHLLSAVGGRVDLRRTSWWKKPAAFLSALSCLALRLC